LKQIRKIKGKLFYKIILGDIMNIFKIIMAFIKGLIVIIIPSAGPKGVINTQISVYRRLKKRFPAASEDDILNSLIMSRCNTQLGFSSRQKEIVHYKAILNNKNKTIEDVIWAIVEYEYILSRGEQFHKELLEIGAEPMDVTEEIVHYRKYVTKRVEEMKAACV